MVTLPFAVLSRLLPIAGLLICSLFAQAQSASYQGIWWNPSESGWGINFAHQGDVIFATWFTYDSNGRGSWLSGSLFESVRDRFVGDIYKTSGPPFSSQAFDPTAVTRTKVGTADVSFNSAIAATFSYVVDNVSQSKAIQPYVFRKQPSCELSTQAKLAATNNFSGIWWNSSESGWGINLVHQGEVIFATLFTYDSDASPLWLEGDLVQTDQATYRGALYKTTGPRFGATPFDPSAVKRTEVGVADVRFSSGIAARLSTTINGFSQTKQMIQTVFRDSLTVCRQLTMPVLRTSYENKNNVWFDSTQVPSIRALGIAVDPDEGDSYERSITFGDFFQEGRYGAFVVTPRFRNVYGIANVADSPGKAYFLSYGTDGKWVDRTSELIRSPADRDVCVTASYSITADFNNDGKPDVYVACNGVDYPLANPCPQCQTDPRWRDVYLSNQVLFLSQPGGSYKRVTVPFQLYGHQAAAGDIDGDGFVDVISINQVSSNERLPVVLLGNGDGTFRRGDSFIPSNLFDAVGERGGLYGVALIPIENRLDVVFGGERTVWLKQNSQRRYSLDSASTFSIPISPLDGQVYQFPLDVLWVGGKFYFHTTSIPANKTEWVTLRYDNPTAQPAIIDSWILDASNFQPASAQIKPTLDGSLVAYTAGCPPPGSSAPAGMCAWRIGQ